MFKIIQNGGRLLMELFYVLNTIFLLAIIICYDKEVRAERKKYSDLIDTILKAYKKVEHE